MLIASWNVNGLGSFSNGIMGILQTLPVDILCLQETKLTNETINADIAIVAERNSYFSFSRSKKGKPRPDAQAKAFNYCFEVQVYSELSSSKFVCLQVIPVSLFIAKTNVAR